MKMPPAPAIVIIATLAAGGLVYAYAHRDLGSLEDTKQQGALLVAAIESYRRDNGVYPDSLGALVPTYVPRIEPPTWGLREWTYRRYEQRIPPDKVTTPGDTLARFFDLSAPENPAHYPVLFWDVKDQRWVLNN
jgi:type II secretory pathway pseudopilin PulG